jgi:hypothetical protein
MFALLFYGNSPFNSKKGDMQQVNKYYSFESIHKHIISQNKDIKVFFHTWDTNANNIDYLIDFYKPAKYIAENYIENNVVNSYLLSINKVNALKCEYEKENNIYFDNVILCRFDIIWTTNVNLSEINNNKFTISYWGNINIDKNSCYDNLLIVDNRKGIHNIFFISNSKNMNIFCNLYNELYNYDNVDKVPIMWHVIERYHLEKTGLINIIDFKFIVAIDLEIESRCFIYGTPGYEHIGKNILHTSACNSDLIPHNKNINKN